MLAEIHWEAIGIGLIIIGVLGAIIVWRAPHGYEDDDGFHKKD